MDSTVYRAIAALRVFLGAAFLFAGLDKVFDWGGSGKAFDATGFLSHATSGAWLGSKATTIVNPTHDFWVSLSGNAGDMSVINFLVVFGEVAVGLALIAGLATRFAGLAGLAIMTLITVAAWSFATGPFNETVVYGTIAAFLVTVDAGRYFGLDGYLATRTRIFERVPLLRWVA